MTPIWWAGVIWALTCGWAISSYTSSFIFRLPRNEYPFGRKPYCDSCNALLQPKDLFPIFSFLLTDGKCRYCGSGVPITYYLIELVYPLCFLQLYLSHGFGDVFLLMAVTLSALVVLVMAAYEAEYYSPLTLMVVAVMGLLMQTLTTATVTTALIGGFICFLGAVFWHRFASKEKGQVDLRALPAYVWMALALGCWLPLPQAALAIVGWIVLRKMIAVFIAPKSQLFTTTAAYALSLSGLAFNYY